MIAWIAAAGSSLAIVPAALFLRNLPLYAPPPPAYGQARPRCSVLIPARNEEATIARAVLSVLRNQTVDLEVIVLNDDSVDRTAQIVQAIAKDDERVRLAAAPPLPNGWCGKQHACHILAQLARHPLLVFMDADVVLMPDALIRMSAFMEQSGAALASGVPRQETVTFSERLLIPLIHFVLLGFLPISRMRASPKAAYSAGCGQLFVARADAYKACGGHSSIRATLHDGPKLPRVFRAASFMTDLFDATDIAQCRMYLNNVEVWRGLAKNAHEGLGSPRLIAPATLLLVGGQILPLCLLVAACLQTSPSPLTMTYCVLGTAAAFLPRLFAVARFRQPLGSALLHPLGICALVAIQWFAFSRSLRRRPAAWRGRTYSRDHFPTRIIKMHDDRIEPITPINHKSNPNGD
jgi:Glycosyl transferase family 2